jgi:pyruvate dehydrogenase E2 component (dihydrolipoamide acetyltransferase)
MPEITMPRLSDSMEEGTILKWLKADGDEVSEGDELAEIETDKATMTYEADAAGVLEIVADEGQTLAIGEVIAKLKGEGDADESSSDDDEAEEPEEEPSEEEEAEGAEPDESKEDEEAEDEEAEDEETEDEEPEAEEETEDEEPSDEEQPAPEPKADDDGGERVIASPVARRLARERGVDLGSLHGTGPGGRIVKADVEGAGTGAPEEEEPAEQEEAPEAEPAGTVAERGTAKGDVVVQEPSRLQGVVARRMAESKATIPDFVIRMDVDMDGCVALRGQIKERLGPDATVPSYNDMVVKACALALREFPRANSAYRDGKFELYGRVNVGVAVAGQDALVVPTVFDADRRSLGDIARETRELAGKVRDGKIRPPELSGGTFTVSNLGMYGVSGFTAVINPPQAAILAVGAMGEVPVVVDGRVVVGHRMEIALTCDHRILYGADAAQFLARIRELLEEPLALVL